MMDLFLLFEFPNIGAVAGWQRRRLTRTARSEQRSTSGQKRIMKRSCSGAGVYFLTVRSSVDPSEFEVDGERGEPCTPPPRPLY